MGGITNYYHGDTAIVADIVWRPDEHLTYCLKLQDSVHREYAFDYGTDIGIDPEAKVGDPVVYLRLDTTCGIWATQRCAAEGLVGCSIKRVRDNRCHINRYFQAKNEREQERLVADLGSRTGVRVEDSWEDQDGHPSDSSGTEASLFLSYARRNFLLAREVYLDLKSDAKADVWFDIAQSAKSPQHTNERLVEWLRSAVYASRGLILLWTEAASNSVWVRNELQWGVERSLVDSSFQLAVLKLADIALPDFGSAHALLIDGNGLWRANGINEELFGGLIRGESRRRWVEQAGLPPDVDCYTYADFESDGGIAINFEWSHGPKSTRSDLYWRLRYGRGNSQKVVQGQGEESPVDLGIQPGDRVGSFVSHYRWGTHISAGVPVWMRSEELDLTADIVLDRYYEEIGADEMSTDQAKVSMHVRGEDIYRRALADVHFEMPDGRQVPYFDIFRKTFTSKNMEKRR